MWHFQYDSKDPSFQYYILDILFDNLRTMNFKDFNIEYYISKFQP